MGHYPDKLIFRCDAVFRVSFLLTRQNGSLAYTEFSERTQMKTKKRFTPNRAHWQEFWSRLDFLRVWDWREGYDSEETGYAVRDGMTWELEIGMDGKSARSKGSNAYPSFESIEKASLDYERFGFLHMSFEALIGQNIPPQLES